MTTEKEIRGKRIRAIRKRLGLSQEQLGKKLGGITKGSISGYESGDVNPTPEALIELARLGKESLDWILTGQEYGVNPPVAAPTKKKGEIETSAEPGKQEVSDRHKRHTPPADLTAHHQASPEGISRTDFTDESFSLTEMVTMTIEVLESKTVYRSALASNVRAFHQAVKMEGEMQGVKEEVSAMRNENRAMAERMERMEQLLLSLGGTVPEKRDKTANA